MHVGGQCRSLQSQCRTVTGSCCSHSAPTHAHQGRRAPPPQGPLGVFHWVGALSANLFSSSVSWRAAPVCCGQNRQKLEIAVTYPFIWRARGLGARVRRCEWCHDVGIAHKRGHSIKDGAWRGHMPIVGARGNPRKGQNKKFGLRPKSKPRAPSRAAPKMHPHIAASALWYLTQEGALD